MDVLAPTDPVEQLLMSLPASFLQTLNDPLTQSLGMAVLGLVSFSLMGLGLFWPHAYTHVSALHLVIRIGLLTGLCAYVYHELILKRCAAASGSGSGKARSKLHADADADADAGAADADAAHSATAKPRRRLAPVAEAAEPQSPAAAAAAAAASPVAAAAAADEPRPQQHDGPLPAWLQAHTELCGADSLFAPLPVPASRRSGSLLFDALNHNGMLTAAHAFVHRTFFAQTPAKAARAAAVAANPSDPVAAAAAGDAAAAKAIAAAGGDAKEGDAEVYPEVVGVFEVGAKVCGHPSIVHGGMTATLLDQVLGIATFVALPKRMCFTANLNMNYRKPLPAGAKVAVRARTTKIDGRKLHASGRVELLSDPNTVFADANALFIMPK